MYKKTRLQLTILYTCIFLFLFWGLSIGIYAWMNIYFGDQGNQRTTPFDTFYQSSGIHKPDAESDSPSDIIMDHLRTILLLLDISVLFGFPLLIWYLTGKTLEPIQKAHEREREFFTNISHDLRTPLTILRGELELAFKQGSTTTYEESLQSCKEEVDSLISLTDTMLSLSRPLEQFEAIDITEVIFDCLHTYEKKARQKGLTMQFRTPDECILINGNRLLLHRLIANLLDNAIKYTTSGTITMTLITKKTYHEVRITDTGIGIAKQDLPKIFTRFYQASPSRNEGGNGLGLAIVKRIVIAHKGSIDCLSEKNVGSSFIVQFPLMKQVPEKNLS